MRFKDLFLDCEIGKLEENSLNDNIEGISRNSQDVKENEVYFCLTDDESKSRQRCLEALNNGASAVVSNFDLPFKRAFKVSDTRTTFALAAKNYYGRACDDMTMIAVSGTNGKTSTSHIIGQMLKYKGKKVGVIGTSGVYYNGKVLDSPLTTPDADFLHKTFLEMKNAGVEYVVMEVSAHAVDQKRVEGILFDYGILTNITQDHLDYFKTMENYEKTKFSFFTPKHIKNAVICADDERAKKLISKCKVPVLTYGLDKSCDVRAIDPLCSLNGTSFVADVCDDFFMTKTNLIGHYNIYNSLAALAICKSLGFSNKDLARSLRYVEPVEGRFNVFNLNGKYAVVDYAHSPDGILNVLKAAKELCYGKVFIVFGCGGNRDTSKRPQMGKIAQDYADFVCLTDDNPRCEKSLDIIADIQKGITKSHMVQPDRKKAIFNALDLASAGDVVIVAGKGAEKYQEIGTTKYPYNDFDVIYEYHKTRNLPQDIEREKK